MVTLVDKIEAEKIAKWYGDMIKNDLDKDEPSVVVSPYKSDWLNLSSSKIYKRLKGVAKSGRIRYKMNADFYYNTIRDGYYFCLAMDYAQAENLQPQTKQTEKVLI